MKKYKSEWNKRTLKTHWVVEVKTGKRIRIAYNTAVQLGLIERGKNDK